MSQDAAARTLVELLQKVEESELDPKTSPVLEEKLSPQELKVLRTVGRERCCIMSGIAGAIRLSLSSATGLIDRLVEKKLVRRERSLEDRRVVQVELTDEGRQAQEAALHGRLELARRLMKSLSAEEQGTLAALLGRISAAEPG